MRVRVHTGCSVCSLLYLLRSDTNQPDSSGICDICTVLIWRYTFLPVAWGGRVFTSSCHVPGGLDVLKQWNDVPVFVVGKATATAGWLSLPTCIYMYIGCVEYLLPYMYICSTQTGSEDH